MCLPRDYPTLQELKLFDPDLLRLEHKGNEVTCHVFEKSVELSKHAAQREYYQPLQLILAIKERNGGKLNSHLWYFSGFCRQLQPDYCFVSVALVVVAVVSSLAAARQNARKTSVNKR